jgi:ABC-2 type transport system permease protein
LTAAFAITAAVNLVIALLIGLVTTAGQPFAGSLALGLSLASMGWIFAAAGAVTAQLSQGHRTATGAGLAAVGAATVLRIAGDAAGPDHAQALSWFTPVGWMQRLHAFTHPQWWIFGLAGVTVAVLSATAYALEDGRDLGSGWLADRLGPATAAPHLRSPLALAWRLHRGTLLVVTAGFALIGLLLGAVADGAAQAGPQLGTFLAKLGVSNSGQALIVLMIYIFAEVTSAYAIVVALLPRSEEVAGLAEPLLATPVSRLRWAGSHLLAAFGQGSRHLGHGTNCYRPRRALALPGRRSELGRVRSGLRPGVRLGTRPD